MNNIIKKYQQFLNENKELTTEIEIREFLKEECNDLFKELFNKISDRFPMDNIHIIDDENNENTKHINELKYDLIETLIDIVIENIKDFDKTWEKSEEVIDVGDTVYSIESGKEYFVSRFGSNNNFYDNNKHVFIDLDSVKKSKNKD